MRPNVLVLSVPAFVDGVWVVAVSGEMDLAGSVPFSTLVAQMVDAGSVDVEFDLEAVSFIDSSGLRALIHASDRLAEAGGSLTIGEHSRAVRTLLDITGLTDRFCR